ARHQQLPTTHYPLPTFLHSSTLRRTAAVVRDWRGVTNRAHFNSCGRKRTTYRLSPRSWPAHAHFHAADPVIASHIGRVHCSLLRREGRALARTAESKRPGAFPGEHVARLIGNGHDRVVEGGLYVHHAMRNMFALLLIECFIFAIFLRRRTGASSSLYWFCLS